MTLVAVGVTSARVGVILSAGHFIAAPPLLPRGTLPDRRLAPDHFGPGMQPSLGDVPMPLSPSRRTLAVLSVAALLALASPGVARALPLDAAGESRGFVQQLLDGAADWVRTFLAPMWQANGSGLDPNGDTGSGLDPNGRPPSNGDNGSGLDPDGRT
jgi:hypothetical protein